MEFLADTDFMQTFGPFIAPALLVFFSVWAGIGVLILRRREAKKEELPHTMSNDEYARLNQKRFGG
jgi:hypothetical protein